MRFIDRIVEVLVVLPRLVAFIRSKQTVFPRHSSGESETHLTISSSKYRPSSFQVSRGLHSKSSTNSCCDRCPCFRMYRKPWRSSGPVHRFDPKSSGKCGTEQKTVEVLETQHFDGVVDVTVVWQSQVPTIQSVQKTMEVPETQCL